MPVKAASPASRFWPKVDASGDCWLWTAALNDAGYGIFTVKRGDRSRNVRAHRWIWEHLVGPIPEGHEVDHLCLNKACVNPDHLEPVTAQENMLRGPTIAARNARKTHCPHGHPYNGDNLKWERCKTSASGWTRKCRTCREAQSKARIR